jgi:hypothetical protein
MEVHLCYLVKDPEEENPEKQEYYVVACGLEWEIEAWTSDPAKCNCLDCVNRAADLVTRLKEEGKEVLREEPLINGPGDPNKFGPDTKTNRLYTIPDTGDIIVEVSEIRLSEKDMARIEEILLDWFETNFIPMSGCYAHILRSLKDGYLTREEWFGLVSVLEAEEEWEIHDKVNKARKIVIA